MLKLDGKIERVADSLKHETRLWVFGRGYNYATALEAAVKVQILSLSAAVTTFCQQDNNNATTTHSCKATCR